MPIFERLSIQIVYAQPPRPPPHRSNGANYTGSTLDSKPPGMTQHSGQLLVAFWSGSGIIDTS
jgi:hypothetical protein